MRNLKIQSHNETDARARLLRQRRRSNAAGFTLIELMVVISIIAILATIVGYNVLVSVDEGNVAAAKAQIKQLENALLQYRLKNRRFPDTLEQLINNANGINYLNASRIPPDPWGNPYVYNLEGSRYTIVSYGANGQPGGEGYDSDIRSDDMD